MELWKLEHSAPSLEFANSVIEEDLLPRLAEEIRSVEVNRKIPGYNVRHTTMFGAKCSASYCQKRDPRYDDELLDGEDASEPVPPFMDSFKPGEVKLS